MSKNFYLFIFILVTYLKMCLVQSQRTYLLDTKDDLNGSSLLWQVGGMKYYESVQEVNVACNLLDIGPNLNLGYWSACEDPVPIGSVQIFLDTIADPELIDPPEIITISAFFKDTTTLQIDIDAENPAGCFVTFNGGIWEVKSLPDECDVKRDSRIRITHGPTVSVTFDYITVQFHEEYVSTSTESSTENGVSASTESSTANDIATSTESSTENGLSTSTESSTENGLSTSTESSTENDVATSTESSTENGVATSTESSTENGVATSTESSTENGVATSTESSTENDASGPTESSTKYDASAPTESSTEYGSTDDSKPSTTLPGPVTTEFPPLPPSSTMPSQTTPADDGQTTTSETEVETTTSDMSFASGGLSDVEIILIAVGSTFFVSLLILLVCIFLKRSNKKRELEQDGLESPLYGVNQQQYAQGNNNQYVTHNDVPLSNYATNPYASNPPPSIYNSGINPNIPQTELYTTGAPPYATSRFVGDKSIIEPQILPRLTRREYSTNY